MLRKEAVTHNLLKILTDLQKENIFNDFLLAGGTALALQIGHRMSDDIDLFTTQKKDYNAILKFLENKYDNINVIENEENYLKINIDDIIVDFVSIKGKVIDAPVVNEGIKMFSINDISAMKLLAIQGRKKAKDYIDIIYMLKNMSINKMFENYKYKYDKKDIIGVKKALAESNNINPYNFLSIKMLNNDVNVLNMYSIIKDHVEKYNDNNGIVNKDSILNKIINIFKTKKK